LKGVRAKERFFWATYSLEDGGHLSGTFMSEFKTGEDSIDGGDGWQWTDAQ